MSVEIVGRACLVPGASSPEDLFRILRERKSTITQIPDDRWDKARYWHPDVGVPGKTYTFAAGVIDSILQFDPAVFGMSPREAESLDPQQRLILRMTWRAMEDAGLAPSRIRSERVGVYVGASSLEYGNLIVGDPAAASPYFMTGNTLSVIANRISHILDVQGPSLTVDTACSSGLVALDLAVRALEAGDIETAIVGSVNVLAHPLSFVGFAQARMLSPYGQCRAYDNQAEGYVRAEGGAVLVLRRTEKALKEGDRSHARIVATGVNSAGRTNGISLPSGEAQAALLRSIYSDRRIDVNRLAFVEGHGTGTRVGDPAEIWSIGTEIGRKRRGPILVGSIKSNIGHTEPASGLLGLMKAMLALEHNYLPASLHFETPNEHIDFTGLNVSVAADAIELMPNKRPRLAGVNSFGFGGTNAHVVISDPERTAEGVEKRDGKLLLASAQSAESLKDLLSSYRSELAHANKSRTAAIASAIGSNRPHLKHRFAIPVQDQRSMIEDIDAFLSGRTAPAAEAGEALKDQARTAFVFSGNGSQWAGMAIDAFNHSAMFQDRFKVVDALFGSISDIALIDLLFAPDLETRLADTRIAQPLLFATQVALADSLIDLGLSPAVVYGHSIGEVAAAYVSDAISLVDAVTIVSKRSRHQHKVAGRGKMIAVAIGAEEAAALARSAGLDNISVAASNAHNAATLSGPAEEIMKFREAAVSKRVASQVLDIDYPFHHPMINVAKKSFLKDLPSVALRRTRVPFISTVTGDVIDGEALNPSYWWRNIRDAVRFDAATNIAIDRGVTLFVEIGPRPILASYLRDTLRRREVGGTVIPSLVRDNRSNVDVVRKILAKSVVAGASFEPARVVGTRNANINLPPLPFATTEFRYARTAEALDIYGDGRRDRPSLAGWRVDGAANAWRSHIDASLYPDLAEHVVQGRSILPGSAFIEMMLAVARRYHGDAAFEINNLEILQAMDLSVGRLLEVSTVISPETGQIEIKSRERLKGEGWTVHAVARCRELIAAPAQVQKHATGGFDQLSGADCYRVARRFGLEYGPSFQLMERLERRALKNLRVTLKEAGAPANPFVAYELDPIATDAAFHGLVGLFDQFAVDFDDSPYIPVRIGVVQLHRPGASIRQAEIDIERVSPHSIKANIRLLDRAGEKIATLMDCRFRRSRLKPSKPLSSQSYHYELVASALSPRAKADGVAATSLPPRLPDFSRLEGTSDSSLLLEAAAYRACYDVCVAQGDRLRRLSDGTRSDDPAFDAFTFNCLFWLERTGLARCEDGRWTVAEECSLPSFEELLTQFLRDEAGRSVEAVLLNDARHMALARSGGESPSPSPSERGPARGAMSDATLGYALEHGPSVGVRQDLLVESLNLILASAPTDRLWHIVELGAVSKSLSARIAKAAGAAKARLTIVEPNDRLRNELELAFADLAHVEVLSRSDVVGTADIIVSASNELYTLIQGSGPEGALLDAVLANGGSMLAFAEAPGLFPDFVLGQRDGWFSRTVDPAFPVGKLATEREWNRLVAEQRSAEGSVEVVNGPCSVSLAVNLRGKRIDAPIPREEPIVTGLVLANAAGFSNPWSAPGDRVRIAASIDGNDRESIRSALATAPDCDVVYLGGSRAGSDASQALLANVGMLSQLVAELAVAPETSPNGGKKPKLAVLLPGGSPFLPAEEADIGAAACSAGLWGFLRVIRNEYPDVEVHSFDFDAGSDDLKTQLTQVADVLGSVSANREWAIHEPSGALCEVRAVSGAVPASKSLTTAFDAATLRQDVVSQIASLEWHPSPMRDPGPGEVRIAVAATALNYRDVMWAMGLLPEEALEDGFAGPSIGMECSGTIAAIGEGVEGFGVGDRVMAIASEAFSTHVIAAAEGVAKLPDSIATEAGATLPVAFLTSYYALVELGRIGEGESILIHGGAGGVGLAALQIAKARGARVLTTASTPEKRRLLTMLGADRVFDSRSLDFVRDVLDATDGAGVDMVLNSLFGDAMERSISLLKPFGRFFELGKRDYFADSKIGLRPFRRNISYFGIDADQLLNSRPQLTTRLFGEIAALFAESTFYPLPFRVFPYDETKDAFRLMQSSGHIGKIVVTPPRPGADPVPEKKPSRISFAPDGTYLIVGGTGGFAFAAAGWLVENGARSIALCSRRGLLDDKAKEALAAWKKRGVTATVHACDVTDEPAVAKLLNALRSTGPLRGVVHAAMVLDDALLANLDMERNRRVIDPKAKGAEILDRLTRDDTLDVFLLFSSVTTLIGNPGQSNYVAGNGFMEGLARSRRTFGLPALAVAFGAISDAGYVAESEATKAMLTKRLGKSLMSAGDALTKVGEYMTNDPGTVEAATVVISELNLHALQALEIVKSPLFATLMRTHSQQPANLGAEELDLPAMIEGKSRQDGERAVLDLLTKEIAAALRIPQSEISPSRLIREIGIDSLMAMELGMNFRQKTGFDLPLNNLAEGATVGDVAQKLYLRIAGSVAAAEEETAEKALVDKLVGLHVDEDNVRAINQ